MCFWSRFAIDIALALPSLTRLHRRSFMNRCKSQKSTPGLIWPRFVTNGRERQRVDDGLFRRDHCHRRSCGFVCCIHLLLSAARRSFGCSLYSQSTGEPVTSIRQPHRASAIETVWVLVSARVLAKPSKSNSDDDNNQPRDFAMVWLLVYVRVCVVY
jgi:hypothetical protein